MYKLGDKFDQDPLEEQFGRQRMEGGRIDNPTIKNYGHNQRKIVLAKSEMLTAMQGNIRKRYRAEAKIDVHDDRELPKPKKNKHDNLTNVDITVNKDVLLNWIEQEYICCYTDFVINGLF